MGSMVPRNIHQEGDWAAWQVWKAYVASQQDGVLGEAGRVIVL